MSAIDLSGDVFVNANNVPVQQFSGPLVGLSVDGSFAITTVSGVNFLDNIGEVRNLIVKLLETDRGTGAFTQLTHEAHLEVECDFRKFIVHNPSSSVSGEDDAYQLTGITLTNSAAAVANDTTKTVSSSKFTFNIDSSLSANIGAPLISDPVNGIDAKATYNAVTHKLTSNWFPTGAVIIDLKSHSTMTDVSDNVKVTVTSQTNGNTLNNHASASDVEAADSAHDEYQISVTSGNIGMTLYSKLSISNCNTLPTLSIESSFQPDNTAAILGSDMNLGDHSVTIHLLETVVDDFTKAQNLSLGVIDGSGNDIDTEGQLAGITVSSAFNTPNAYDADNFSVNIGLDSLAGTLGNNMKSELQSSIDGINDDTNADATNLLLKTFIITVDQINFDSTGGFSGFMRTLLAGDSTRALSMPIKEGEKLIIKTAENITLNVQPFTYTGFTTSNTATQTELQFNLIDNMAVFGVLKHKEDVDGDNNAPVLQTDGLTVLT